MHENELYHYGVKGMKWGVIRKRHIDRRLARKQEVNETLTKKAAKYDLKSSKRIRKNLKKGYEGYALMPTKKSAKLNVKAARLEKKSLKLDENSSKYLHVKKKAAKKRLKAMRSMNVSDFATRRDYKYSIKAAKARYKIKKNNLKISSLDRKSVELGRELLADE